MLMSQSLQIFQLIKEPYCQFLFSEFENFWSCKSIQLELKEILKFIHPVVRLSLGLTVHSLHVNLWQHSSQPVPFCSDPSVNFFLPSILHYYHSFTHMWHGMKNSNPGQKNLTYLKTGSKFSKFVYLLHVNNTVIFVLAGGLLNVQLQENDCF